MSPLEIFLIIFAATLATTLVVIIAIITYSYVIRGARHECNGKPYDTVNSETWYAKCGREAPHEPHMFKEYQR